jgi:prepilin-type N-terminal cleavage/methylation domain-containing protein/prepilin-type processing-associated H-X9-DG protein
MMTMTKRFSRKDCGRSFPSACAFTLVELLIVIGIIAILISFLLPAISNALVQARTIACESNVRSILQAMTAYSSAYQNQYPPNVGTPAPGMYWYDQDRIGKFISSPQVVTPGAEMLGGVFVCPDDNPQSLSSYTMNAWASSLADSFVTKYAGKRGIFWAANVRNASQMILITEKWSSVGSATAGWMAPPTIGYLGTTPGQRFGAGAGLTPAFNAGPYGKVSSELCYERHRNGKGTGTQPYGRVTIGYADGHAEINSDADLCNYQAGTSTLHAYWSPLDSNINN